jgi:hypothetical protein
MVSGGPPTDRPTRRGWAWLRAGATFVLYALMLLAVLIMWDTHAPPFIYVAF